MGPGWGEGPDCPRLMVAGNTQAGSSSRLLAASFGPVSPASCPNLTPTQGPPARLWRGPAGPRVEPDHQDPRWGHDSWTSHLAAAVACAAIGGAPVATGDPNDNVYFDKPGRYDSDVPFMNYEARLAAPCDNFEINTFGRGPGGEPLQCHWIPNQWPPVYTGFWVISPEIFGVQQIGSPCPERSGGRAGARRASPVVPRRPGLAARLLHRHRVLADIGRGLVRKRQRKFAGFRRASRYAPRRPCEWSPTPTATALLSASSRRRECPSPSVRRPQCRAGVPGETAGPPSARRRSLEH